MRTAIKGLLVTGLIVSLFAMSEATSVAVMAWILLIASGLLVVTMVVSGRP